MSEQPTPYGQSLCHGSWRVQWGVHPDEPETPIMLSLENDDGVDEWFAITSA